MTTEENIEFAIANAGRHVRIHAPGTNRDGYEGVITAYNIHSGELIVSGPEMGHYCDTFTYHHFEDKNGFFAWPEQIEFIYQAKRMNISIRDGLSHLERVEQRIRAQVACAEVFQ